MASQLRQPDPENTLGDSATSVGRSTLPGSSSVSLGDERTVGGDAARIDTLIDGLEIVDLEARYTIDGTLGQGGMGAVVLATDTRLGRKVAIKRILGEAAGSKTAVARFLTEAKAIAALNHPNIVQIFDYGRAKDGPFLIMEYVDGGNLAERCRDVAIPLEEAIDLACHVCDGLAKAHDGGIIHRDIKPANILLTKDGVPKLTDFGLAKAEAVNHGHTITGTGAVMGTPGFMPPEQQRDAAEVDHRSDLWSLAATIYQMVTGRSPRIIRLNDIPAALQGVLGKALEDRKDSRYQSVREFRDALRTSVRVAAAAVAGEVIEGRCSACGVQNDLNRKFCKGCAGPLVAPCLKCGEANPIWDEICGSCGARQSPLVDKRREDLAVKQAEAEGLLGDCDFGGAAIVATQLREQSHPKLAHLTDWANSFLEQVEKSRAEQVRQAVDAMTEAGKHEAAHDYLSAMSAIEGMPKAMRESVLPGIREPAAQMLARLKRTQAEAERLEQLVRERLAAKALDDLLPHIEKLLSLRPDRADVQRLRSQLVERRHKQTAARDEAVSTAKGSLAAHDYENALRILGTIPAAAVTPEVVNLREHAEGLLGRSRSLSARITDAVAARRLDGLLPVLEQYLELKPEDTENVKLRQSLVDREAAIVAEIASRRQEAERLAQACRFEEARESLAGIPESRRAADVKNRLGRLERLATKRQEAMAALSTAKAVGYAQAIRLGQRYESERAAAKIEDAVFAGLLAETRAAQAAEEQAQEQARVDEERARERAALVRMAGAVALTVVALGMAWLWGRSSLRARSFASAIAKQRWDDALAIEPGNVAALVGRARNKIEASPPDISGAFSDLEEAGRSGLEAADVMAARGDAYAARARENAQVGKLDAAAQDLAEAESAPTAAEKISQAKSAIMAAWLSRAEEASRRADGSRLQQAILSAKAAGANDQRLLAVWEEFARIRIKALDPKGLEVACVEGKKCGLSRSKEAGWWLELGELGVEKGDERAVRSGAAGLKALGLQPYADKSAEVVRWLKARGLMLEASTLQAEEDTKSAVAKAVEALSLETVTSAVALKQPMNSTLRVAVMDDCRDRFDTSIAGNDWDAALRVAAIAEAIEPAASGWVGKAIAKHPGGLSAVPPKVLERLPAATLAALPRIAIAAVPPIRNSIGIELTLIPAGTFTMGRAGGYSDETPHQVTLTKPFYIGVYEVTNAQWKRVMGSVPSEWKDADRPVENVTWEQAVEFCRKLSVLPEERNAGRVYRLPTEAEWEYACRAGTSTRYSFGDDESRLGEYAWYESNSDMQSHSVGQKEPNAWGLFDMHGNVWEWCSDWFEDFGNGAVTDPQGPSRASDRVRRGGGWSNTVWGCRSAIRNGNDPLRRGNLGFRLALSPSGVQPASPEGAGKK